MSGLSQTLLRAGLEILIVIAIGGMLVSVIRRLRLGQISVHRCPECERPTTRANGICKHCGVALPDAPR